jgi:hypothetical protein
LNICRKPSSARRVETSSEVAMLMIAIRKLKEANDKCKKKGINDKHNPKKYKIEEGWQSETD